METSPRLPETVQDDKFVIQGGYRGRRSGRGNRNLSATRRSNQCPKVPVQTARSSTTGREGDAMKRTVFLACLFLLTGSLAYAADGGSWKSAEAEVKDSRGQTMRSAVFDPTTHGGCAVRG